MSGTRQPQPITTMIPTYHQRLLRQVRDATHSIQSFNPSTRTLTTLRWCVPLTRRDRTLLIFYRPVDNHGRVVPSSLREYRRSHEFLGPCCLCPLFARNAETRVFTEAAMFVAPSGQFSGEYVAQCAKGECGYLGQLAFELCTDETHRPPFQCYLNAYIRGLEFL
jgi:hypothetical protein